MTTEKQKLLRELQFEEASTDLTDKQKRALKSHLKKEIHQIEDLINSANDNTSLDKLSGPVTSNLCKVLLRHKIVIQAYHSRSFTGNHCSKYLQPSVFKDLSNSIELITKSLTTNQHLVLQAENLGYKFEQLNALYSKIHQLISHSQQINSDELPAIQRSVTAYISYIRRTFPSSFPVKLHILEHHVIPWIERFGFGMGRFGEQGGESCHREFNRLKRVMHAIPNPLSQLTAIMKEHIILTHPHINAKIPKVMRKIKKEVT